MHPQGDHDNRFLRWTRLSLLVTGMLALVAGPAQALELRVVDDGHTAGYVTLAWENDGDVELQQRDGNGAWRTVYRGADSATTLSGLDDGEFAWRARPAVAGNVTTNTPWGKALNVEIAHHPLQRALGFFAVGAVMFVILLACIALPWRVSGQPAAGGQP